MYVLIIFRFSSQRNGNKAKLNKVMTLEDINSSSTITLSPIIHKQQPEDKHTYSHVQDLYPPTSPHSSLPVAPDIDHYKPIKNILPELPHPYSQALPKISIEANAPPWTSPSADSMLKLQVVQDVDHSSIPVERRTAAARCVDKEPTAVARMKQQSSGQQRRKRVKTISPKIVNENSSRDKLELKGPVTEDICNWLQLEVFDSRELDERQQNVSKSCDQSHDLPAIAGNSDSQDTEHLTHHQTTLTISTDKNKLSTQGVSLPVPSPIVQQQRLAETASNIQPTTCKH